MRTPLPPAAVHNAEDSLRELLRRAADPNAEDMCKRIPLLMALYDYNTHKLFRRMKILLQYGARCNFELMRKERPQCNLWRRGKSHLQELLRKAKYIEY
mmetsp:Transcript_7051/g.26434  ORF Transcript_7051/g.26434 Transcript_7051/m.26434 type:complete len:99 (+) Transcript_7051:438-734(+)